MDDHPSLGCSFWCFLFSNKEKRKKRKKGKRYELRDELSESDNQLSHISNSSFKLKLSLAVDS